MAVLYTFFLSFFSGAGECFTREKGYSLESISLTFKKLKSPGRYEGEVSWEPFKGKLGDHTSYNHHCGQPVSSGPHVIPYGQTLIIQV